MGNSVGFELSINLGNLLTIVSFLGGGVAFVVAIRGRVDALSQRTINVENELRKLTEVLVMQGRHDEKLTAIDNRVINQGRRLDNLTFRVDSFLDSNLSKQIVDE